MKKNRIMYATLLILVMLISALMICTSCTGSGNGAGTSANAETTADVTADTAGTDTAAETTDGSTAEATEEKTDEPVVETSADTSSEITSEKVPETTAEITTSKPEQTTVKPEETTKVQEETTKKPEETTKVSEETTKKPEETTKVPEETTKKPEETTKVPEETTKNPEETTKVPEETTKKPEETTKVPEETAKKPEETTKVPEETTKVPEETTKVPEETTKVPETTTEPEIHIHSFNKKNTQDVYLASKANCGAPAMFYYSCECGEPGTETFASGTAANHSGRIFKEVIAYPDNENEGKGLYYCSVCDGTFELGIGKIDKTEYVVMPYLQNSGKEYINTGVLLSKEDTFVTNLDYQFVTKQGRTWAGAYWYSEFTYEFFNHLNRTDIKVEYNLNGDYLSHTYDGSALVYTENLSSMNFTNLFYGFFRLSNHVSGWWGSYDGIQIARLYRANFIRNGEVVGVYIPVLNPKTGKAGLWDTVSCRFLGNDSGIGNFVLPEGYKSEIKKAPTNDEKGIYVVSYPGLAKDLEYEIPALDRSEYIIIPYIENKSSGAIDTGLRINYYDKAEAVNDIQYISNAANGWSGANYFLQYHYIITNTTSRFTLRLEYNTNNDHIINTYKNETFIDGTDYSQFSNVNNVIYGFFVLGNQNQTWYGDAVYQQNSRIFGGTVTVNGEMLGWYVPVQNVKTGQVGLYDYISCKFLGNTNEGDTFIDPHVFDVKKLSTKSPSGAVQGEYTCKYCGYKVIKDYKKPSTVKHNIADYTAIDELVMDANHYVQFTSVYADKYVPVYRLPNSFRTVDSSSAGIPGVSGKLYMGAQAIIISELTEYRNGKVSHHYVPMKRNSDGVEGLFDTVDSRFYPLKTKMTPRVDDLYFRDYKTYDTDLSDAAVMSVAYRYTFEEKLTSWGYRKTDFYFTDDNLNSDIEDATSFTLYYKTLYRDGEIYNLYYLVCYGTITEAEFVSNCRMGPKTDRFHQGFGNGADFVLARIKKYMDEDPEHNKLIIAGHSRGGAIASIILSKLIEEGKYFRQENVVAYTYACPNYSNFSSSCHYDNLYHIISAGDIVACIPLSQWGFGKEGVSIELPMNDEILAITDENMKYRQNYDGLPEVGYQGNRTDVRSKMNVVASLISEDVARDPKNKDIVSRLVLIYAGKEEMNVADVVKILKRVNWQVDLFAVNELYQFAISSQESNQESHVQETYFAYVRAYHQLNFGVTKHFMD